MKTIVEKEMLNYLKHKAEENYIFYDPLGRTKEQRIKDLYRGYVTERGFYQIFKPFITSLSEPSLEINEERDDGGKDFISKKGRIDVKSTLKYFPGCHMPIPCSMRADIYVLLEVNLDTGEVEYKMGIDIRKINKQYLTKKPEIFKGNYYAIPESQVIRAGFDISSLF
jgi:hypothetical protein